MLLPVKWLRDYVDIDASTKEISEKITDTGSHVESIEDRSVGLSNVVVGKILKIEFIRDNEQMATSVVPKYDEQAKRALIGVTAPVDVKSVGFGESIALAFATVVNIIYQMYSGLIGMITGSVSAELSGPVGVAQMTSQAAHLGLVPLLQFAALLSLNLGVINLLPIPALDGGHFVVLLVEAIRGKAIEAKYVRVVQMAGIILLLSLMFFATAQDVGRLFG